MRTKVHSVCYRDGVLIAIHPRKLHLVPYQGDVEVMALGVLHVMVHRATVEQREDDKRGRGGEGPIQPAMLISRLPRAIERDLLPGQVGKHHRRVMHASM